MPTLTADDIKMIVDAQKEIFVSKEDLVGLELKFDEKFDKVMTVLDGIAQNMKDYHEEATVNRSRLERMEEWVKQAAQKIGVEYKV